MIKDSKKWEIVCKKRKEKNTPTQLQNKKHN